MTKVLQMRGVYYTTHDGRERKTGVIAQEIEEILPEVVITSNTSQEIKSVAYGNMVGILIEAIKALSERMDMLENVSN